MTYYSVDLKLTMNPLLPEIDIYSLSTAPWELLNLNLFNPEVKNLFEILDLDLRMGSMFTMKENSTGNVHLDGIRPSDRVKINWVIGSDHIMNWYSIKNTTIQKLHEIRVPDNQNMPSRNYVSYNANQVELIHSQSVGYPSLIQSGIPHNVINFKGIRKCISIMLYTKSGNFLTMSQAIQKFSKYR